MHFALRHLILRLVNGEMDTVTFARMLERMVTECGIENMLRSWTTWTTTTPRGWPPRCRTNARAASPRCCNSPCPAHPTSTTAANSTCPEATTPRCALRCAGILVSDDNAALAWTKNLIAMRQHHRALRVGDFSKTQP